MEVTELSDVIIDKFKRLIIPAKHFNKCPLSELSSDMFCEGWTISRGGLPVLDTEWAIEIYQCDEEGNTEGEHNVHRWIMPKVFTMLFKHFELLGDEQRCKIITDSFISKKAYLHG